jgi:hypothetical protein
MLGYDNRLCDRPAAVLCTLSYEVCKIGCYFHQMMCTYAPAVGWFSCLKIPVLRSGLCACYAARVFLRRNIGSRTRKGSDRPADHRYSHLQYLTMTFYCRFESRSVITLPRARQCFFAFHSS